MFPAWAPSTELRALVFPVITALVKSAAWPLFAPAILAFPPHAVSELPGK